MYRLIRIIRTFHILFSLCTFTVNSGSTQKNVGQRRNSWHGPVLRNRGREAAVLRWPSAPIEASWRGQDHKSWYFRRWDPPSFRYGKCYNHVSPNVSWLQKTRRFFALPLEEKMKAKHPPQANPNRGYSFVGQENVANISGYEKGKGPGKTRDIKVGCLDHLIIDDIN